jgi:foldase protein PrsA
VAAVNGAPIARQQLIDLLVRSKGADVLEQLIGLEVVSARAAEQGVTVTHADVDREYERALRRMADPLATVTAGPFDRASAERLLERVLRERQTSKEEFHVTLRRNAVLRRLVELRQVFPEQQLEEEFKRGFGERVRVRHIQLGTPREVARVRERLAAGEDFATLAGRYSANTASAVNGGLLEPFSAGDDALPAIFRQTAFALRPGIVSDAVRIGEWYHLLKLESFLPPAKVELNDVRDELEQRLRRRESEPAMRALFEKLLREANIRIYDPVLQAAYERRQGAQD